MASNNFKINIPKFVKSIVDGKTQGQAYIDAGGAEGGAASNGSKFTKTPTIKRAINEALQERCLNSLTKLPALTEKAMDRLAELVESKDDKIALQASKVVLDKARDFLPKEVNISHIHEVTGNDANQETNARILAIAAKLQGKAASGDGFASGLIEAAGKSRSGGVQGYGDGAEGDGEEPKYAVYTEQEAETST